MRTTKIAGQAAETTIDELKRELQELDLLCSAVGESDATGKLRGKLSRLHASLESFESTGDFSPFREDLRATKAFVEHQHSLDPMTVLLARLSDLDRHVTEGNSHA
jgi:hypothetical protein